MKHLPPPRPFPSATHPGIASTREFASDLPNWTPALHGVASVGVGVTPNCFETGIDKVGVPIPKSLAAGSQVLGHLKVPVS